MSSNGDVFEKNMDIISCLTPLGCSKSEAEIFSALLAYPDGITVVQLSKALSWPRTTLYDRLEKLIKIGLVKKGLSEEGAVFFAESKDRKSVV